MTSSICAAMLIAAASPGPNEYSALTAQEKIAVLWEAIQSDPYEVKPALDSRPGPSLRQIFSRDLARAITDEGDVLAPDRTKIIHGLGSTAKVVWRPVISEDFTNAAEPGTPVHPFTGLFAEESSGIMRFSLALPRTEGGNFVPGLAIKFPISGKPSRNLFVMERLEGQGNNSNPFASTFTQVLPNPRSAATIAGTFAFERVVEDAITQDLLDLATVNQDGDHVSTAQAPPQIWLRPIQNRAYDRVLEARLRAGQTGAPDFRDVLESLEASTHIYDVWARIPGGRPSEEIKIAEIHTESPFVTSRFQDERLYFQHNGFQLKSVPASWLTLPRLGGPLGF